MDIGKNCLSRKILINAITLDNANIVPLLLKVKCWQKEGADVTFLGNRVFKDNMERVSIVSGYDFIEFKSTKIIKSKFQFIFESLKRNILAIFYIKKVKGSFDIIYSLSSVLDLIIFPHLLKKFDKKIKWAAVLDNTVPFSETGNKLIKFLSWLFFRISLVLLKKTDRIFVISEDLKSFLLKKNFSKNKICLTGIGIETDLIEKSTKNPNFESDSLFIGRLEEAKGIYDMLEVLKIIKKSFPDFLLSIMGRGDEKMEIKFKKTIREFELEENVKFLGYRIGQEKFDIIKSARSFLFLSHRESFGISLLEAVSSGKPAFAYNLDPFKKIYQNNEVYMFDKHDYLSVAKKVIDIFDNNEFENKNGPLLLGKYSWQNIAGIESNSFKNL